MKDRTHHISTAADDVNSAARHRSVVAAACCLVVLAAVVCQPAAAGTTDWPTYGHDLHRTFSTATALTPATVPQLAPAWFFETDDAANFVNGAVSAQPIVVGGSVYVGSWNGKFYAIDALTGAERWHFDVDPQPAILPQPGNPQPGDVTSDGGLITSTAIFVRHSHSSPDLVIFGAGYTLYALVANDGGHGYRAGDLYWKHVYSGRPELPPDPANDPSRIFSSPAVVGNRVFFSVDADGSAPYRGYLVAANLSDGTPKWTRELDVDTAGNILNDGCGNVWASPTIIERTGVEVVGVSDCHYGAAPPYNERVLAVSLATGEIKWIFTPPRISASSDPLNGDPNNCDFDFGATANLGTDALGKPTFLGLGGKDGTYYSIDPATGLLRWWLRVVFGGFAGGFIGSTAYDGTRVYGATAIGDFGRFEDPGAMRCQPDDPSDTPTQEPSVHAINATTAHVDWEQPLSQSFGATSVANGMVFVGTGLTPTQPNGQIQVRDAATGLLLVALPLPAASNSGVVVAGNAIFFGTGTSEQGSPAGVYAYTPGGVPPQLDTTP